MEAGRENGGGGAAGEKERTKLNTRRSDNVPISKGKSLCLFCGFVHSRMFKVKKLG